MESTSSTGKSNDNLAEEALQRLLEEESREFYKETVARMTEMIVEAAQERSEFTKKVVKQLWERNSENDKLKMEFKAYREKCEQKMDTMRQLLKEEQEEVAKLLEEKKQWSAVEDSSEDSKNAELLVELEKKLVLAIDKIFDLEKLNGEKNLKIQHEQVTKKLLEVTVQEEVGKVSELNRQLDVLKAEIAEKEKKIKALEENLTKERQITEKRVEHWSKLIGDEEEKCRELETEINDSHEYCADWQRYATELQDVLDKRDDEFAAIIDAKDEEIAILTSQLAETLPNNSVGAGFFPSFNSMNDPFHS